MADIKKIKNIFKYSSLLEILNNSNINFAKDEKPSTGCCNFTNEDDKNKKIEEENKKPIQTPVQTPKEDNSELLKECQDLLKEIQKFDHNYNVDFSQYTSKEQLIQLKDELTAKLAELKEEDQENPEGKDKNPEHIDPKDENPVDARNPKDKEKDKDSKGKDEEKPKINVDISKITVEEYVGKIYAFKDSDEVPVDTLKEYINIINAKFDEYKKRLDKINKINLAGSDYDEALKILKEYNSIMSDIDSALILPKLKEYSIYNDLEEDDSTELHFVEGISSTVRHFKEDYENINKGVNDIIEEHDEKELKKQLDEEKHKQFVEELNKKLPAVFKFKSLGAGYPIFLVDSFDENKKYGKYSYYGGGTIYLFDFEFYIKLEDFNFFAESVSKLGIDEEFTNSRRLLACHFHSRSLRTNNLILLIDLTNKDIFTKSDDGICYLEYDENKNCLKNGEKYSKKNYSKNQGKGLEYKEHIKNNRFDYEYLNDYGFYWYKKESFE